MAMQVKRFFAADMRQAMNRVKEELGADATILSTRRLAGGIELTAALDYSVQSLPARANPALEAELRKTQQHILGARADFEQRVQSNAGDRDRQLFDKLMAQSEQLHDPAPAIEQPAVRTAEQQQELAQMRAELSGLRELIQMQMNATAWQGVKQQQPGHAELWSRLQKMGLPSPLVQELMQVLPAGLEGELAWQHVLRSLASSIPAARGEPVDRGGVIALVGPAGMGKTTTLAKLAARHVLEHGPQGLAIVSMDSFRIGAQEQLKTLGRILGVTVTHVEAGESLDRVLGALNGKRLVLLDTAGLPAQDPALVAQLDSLAASSMNIQTYLVLAATSQERVLKAAWHAYKRCKLTGCVITKLDEAVSLGEVLGVAIGQGLAVAYTTDGPRIPDDIQFVDGRQLIKRAVKMQDPETPDDTAMASFYTRAGQSLCQVG